MMTLLLVLCLQPTEAEKQSAAIETLCEDYWQFLLRESPTWATQLGDPRYNDKLSDLGPEARAASRKAREEFLERLKAIKPPSKLETITLDILRQRLELELGDDEHKFYQWDVDQMYGLHIQIFQLVNYHPLKKDADRATFVKRLEAFPKQVDQYIENLREGMKEGRVATKMATARVAGQLRALVDKQTSEWPIAVPGGDAAEKHVRPAFTKLLDFLEKEYKPRDEVALSKLPGGLNAYEHVIKRHTSLTYSARELHDIGIGEMESIEREMLKITKGGSIADYRKRVSSDRANYCESREEYLDRFRKILVRVEERLPHFFAKRPTTRYEVKAIEAYREKDSVAAFYEPASEDGKRPGVFWANCHRVDTRPKYNMTALAVHEAVPGHHLQIAFAQDLTKLPKFMRHTGSTAFVEGWALYAERLGDEMGVYETDLDRFGMLNYQAWRAARLVVDTGMHALDWSRDRAIEYFKRYLALPEGEIINEIDRYIIWPGQALAYKIGQRKIQALREKASTELGKKFRLTDFHVELLRHGAVPLPTLETLVDLWIEAQKKKP